MKKKTAKNAKPSVKAKKPADKGKKSAEAKAADKKFRKKLIIAAAAIVAVLGVYFIFFHSTPERTLDRYCKAITKGDVKEVISYTFETSFDPSKSADEYYNTYTVSDDKISEQLNEYRSMKGKIEASVVEISDVSKEEADAMKEDLSQRYNNDEINEVKSATLKLATAANPDLYATKDVYVIKVGWKWYVYTGS